MNRLAEKVIMAYLVRKWKRKILQNPESEEVQQMAAQTGRIRDLRKLHEPQ